MYPDDRRKSFDATDLQQALTKKRNVSNNNRFWQHRKTEAVAPKKDEMSAIFAKGMGADVPDKYQVGKSQSKIGRSGMRTERSKY